MNQSRCGIDAGGWWDEALDPGLRLLTLAGWLYDVYGLLVRPRPRGALVALWWKGRVLCERSARGENTVWIYGVLCSEQPLVQMDGLEIVAVEWLTPEQALARELTGHLRDYLKDVA